MSLYNKFIHKAKERIALRHLTLTEVAESIGLSTAQVSRVLNGKFRIKGDNLLRMAMILEISLDEIIFPKTDLVVNSMTMAQGLARYGVPEEEILQGIRNAAKTDPQPTPIEPKTVTWSGVDPEKLKKDCEKVDTVNVKSGINGEWVAMPVDEFFRMLGNKMMLEGKRWPEH